MITVFVLGFFSGIFALLAAALALVTPEKKSTPRAWSSITRMHYTWKTELSFEEPFTTHELMRTMPKLMARLPHPEPLVTVDPNHYEVEIDVHARFVGRDKPQSM